MTPPTKSKTQLLAQLARCSSEDFDGHTEFYKLSARERILWLSHTAFFVHGVAKSNPGLGCTAMFPAKEE